MLAKNGHKKESLDGTLPKKVLRLALVATCADAKSQLRNHNLNHLFDALMKRYKKQGFFGCKHIQPSLSFLYSYPEDNVEYGPLVHKLNWFSNPVRPIAPRLVPVRDVFKNSLDTFIRFIDLFIFLCLQSCYDYSERRSNQLPPPVNYRAFVEKLEEMAQPVIKKYLPTSDDDEKGFK